MTGQLSAQVLEIIRKMQQNELTESVIYEKIAVFAKLLVAVYAHSRHDFHV